MRPIAATVLLLALWGAPLGAQVRGVPIVASGAPQGFSLGVGVAFPDEELGGGTAWAGDASFQHGRIGASVTAALVNHVEAPERGAVGLRADYVLLRSATEPFQLLAFAGAGATELGDAGREWRIPAGMSFAFRMPLPVLTLVPWIAARAQWTGASDDLALDPGIGGGIELGWERLGLRASYDKLLRPGRDEATFGLGLTYTFTSRF